MRLRLMVFIVMTVIVFIKKKKKEFVFVQTKISFIQNNTYIFYVISFCTVATSFSIYKLFSIERLLA